MNASPSAERPGPGREESNELAPKYDGNGLITAVACDAHTGDVLMVAHMNEAALNKTIETGEAWYWSRSRQKLWHKGATSNAVQKVREIRIDCDQDAVLLLVERKQAKDTCHTGREHCFYRRIVSSGGAVTLADTDAK